MGSSRVEYLSGKGKYVRMFTVDKYGKYSLLLYLDKPSLAIWEQLKSEGILNVLKKDDDGDYVRLSRPVKKTFRGIDTVLRPPDVMDKDGKPMVANDWIGNGSDITAKLTCYTFAKQFGGGTGAAIRLEGIKVHNLVPYVASDRTPEEQEHVEGLDTKVQPW